MVEKRLYKIIATFGALVIYLFFIYGLVDFVKSNEKIIQDFGYNVDDAIVVEIDANEANKPIKTKVTKPLPVAKPKPILESQPPKPLLEPIILPPDPEPKVVEEKKEVIELPQQNEKESRDKFAKSAKDLFSTIRTEKYDKVLQERRKQDAARASRLKKQKAAQARKKQEEKRRAKERKKALAQAKAALQSIENASAASHKKSGQEDAFWSPVANHIEALWQRTIQTQDGLRAEVRITIDNNGRLSYKIIRLSNNSLFDKKLKIFLENLEYETFPKYRGGRSTSKILELVDSADS